MLGCYTELARNYLNYYTCNLKRVALYHVQTPDNMVAWKTELTHNAMEQQMYSARFDLMPILQDTQGFISCEIATYGIPLIASNIRYTIKYLSDAIMWFFISNDNTDLEGAIGLLSSRFWHETWDRYFTKNTTMREIKYGRDE